MMIHADKPILLEGGMVVDDRGSVSFVNEFDFSGVKRFYVVSNHVVGFVRAWHAHKREAKFVVAVSGGAIVAAVKIDNWNSPSKDLPVHRYVLSADKPSVLCIPRGFANGCKTLSSDTRLLFLSTSSLEESKEDDIRYDPYYWDVWDVIER